MSANFVPDCSDVTSRQLSGSFSLSDNGFVFASRIVPLLAVASGFELSADELARSGGDFEGCVICFRRLAFGVA
jgi:hypothetical protein